MSTIADDLQEAAERIEKALKDADIRAIHSGQLKHTAERLRELVEEYRNPRTIAR